ncbi:MAG: pstS [Bacteroidetes bacterium]|jgi:phosphate transport system substrate-binding protein|nr:pstS [Bacteroidota bacterium]
MRKIGLFAVALAVIFSSCNSGSKKSENTKLSGAGATFPAPFYSIVFKAYTKAAGNDVTYGAVGSGGGIRSLKDKTVDFGASDVFLSDDEAKEFGVPVVHIPTTMGAVVVAYNLKGIPSLKLTSEVISEIYRGKITKWNDAKLMALNPGVALPDKAITPVYRSDGSGTTYVFSDYMSKTDEAWKAELGSGKSLKFTVGVAAKGNPGVSGVVAETDGSIGYIGSEYALAQNIPSAQIKNAAGNFIEASTASISAAADGDIPADTRLMITNSANPKAYPISTFTWIIAYKEQKYGNHSEAQAKALVGLLNYIISKDAQDVAAKTHYAPLPEAAIAKTKAIIESITFDGKSIGK